MSELTPDQRKGLSEQGQIIYALTQQNERLKDDNEALRNRVAVLEENEFWSETEALRNERDELLKDKERLDYLQHNAIAVVESESLRAAIDAAMKERKAEKE